MPAIAQEKTAPAFKMVEFHMALLKRGPNWVARTRRREKKSSQQHLAYFTSLIDTGKAVIGGPLTDESEIRGLYVLRAKSPRKLEHGLMQIRPLRQVTSPWRCTHGGRKK